MTFINKIVVVTGAASGIGEAVSISFAKLSARLYLVDKDDDNLKKIAETCEKLSRAKVFTAAVDLTDDDLVEKTMNSAKNHFGRIDVVVNCVGIYKTTKILDANVIETFDEIMRVNLRSAVRITNCVAPALIESKGNLIFISSVAAQLTSRDCFAYNASKAALCHFSKCVALELAQKGVRVNCVSPGPVPTNILVNAGSTKEESAKMWKSCAELVPLKQLPKPEEVAELVIFIASDKAISMTGSTYAVDAGLSLLGCQDAN